jgi:hypothetical protein
MKKCEKDANYEPATSALEEFDVGIAWMLKSMLKKCLDLNERPRGGRPLDFTMA